MRFHIINIAFVVTIVLLIIRHSNAQVINDDCANAINLGMFDGSGNETCIDGTNGHDTVIVTNNNNSVPNFPYLSMTGCFGYTNATTTIANDVWYKFKAKKFDIRLYIGVFGMDTLHLNVWLGSTCSSLSPLGCYTYDLVATYYDTVFGGSNDTSDYVYLQLSGATVGATGDFAFCLRGYFLWQPVFYNVTPDTLCFDYDISHTNIICSDDGTASIIINAGNPPYTYNWFDSNIDSIRSGLSAGKYYITITDVNGCQEIDSIEITGPSAITLTTGTNPDTAGTSIGVAWVTVSGGTSPYSYQWDDPALQTTDTASGLQAGTYTVVISDSNGCVDSISVTVGNITGISERTFENNVQIYPNLNTGEFTLEIKLQKTTTLSIRLYQITGRLILNQNLTGLNYYIQQIDLSKYAKGIYYVRVVSDEGVFTRKVIYQ